MDLTILEIEHHRNGVSGAPFCVIRFCDNTEERCNMLGIVFAERGHVAVFDADLLGKGEIRFMHNSWRGDWYEKALRDAIEDDIDGQDATRALKKAKENNEKPIPFEDVHKRLDLDKEQE